MYYKNITVSFRLSAYKKSVWVPYPTDSVITSLKNFKNLATYKNLTNLLTLMFDKIIDNQCRLFKSCIRKLYFLIQNKKEIPGPTGRCNRLVGNLPCTPCTQDMYCMYYNILIAQAILCNDNVFKFNCNIVIILGQNSNELFTIIFFFTARKDTRVIWSTGPARCSKETPGGLLCTLRTVVLHCTQYTGQSAWHGSGNSTLIKILLSLTFIVGEYLHNSFALFKLVPLFYFRPTFSSFAEIIQEPNDYLDRSSPTIVEEEGVSTVPELCKKKY